MLQRERMTLNDDDDDDAVIGGLGAKPLEADNIWTFETGTKFSEADGIGHRPTDTSDITFRASFNMFSSISD